MNTPTPTRIILPGPPGEPRVAKALFGDGITTGSMVVEGYALAKQLVTPDAVWIEGGLQKAWEGKDFPGAFTLVPKEGARTTVNYVETSDPDLLAEVDRRIEYWNYRPEGWYRRDEIAMPDGTRVGIELLNEDDPSNLQIVEGNKPEGYEASIDEMERQALVEFNPQGQREEQDTEVNEAKSREERV
ncbi:hypothetical protein HY024_02895 [Candidatus Curtissbacteria bacterium]|nr:hypothetical protein [Candidatus Curtissbacteria bacterium]